VELGVSSIWLGLESEQSNYAKLEGADTLRLTRELREHGIVLLGSTILGLEHHTPENIEAEIERAVAHQTDLHQFMLYTPVPGTPLYAEMVEQGRLLDGVDLADIHGQDRFNFRHAAISREESNKFLESAFRWDFERNGPSLFRVCRTTFQGWMRYKNHPDQRVRERVHRETKTLRHAYTAVLWAMEHRLKNANFSVSPQIRALRKEIEQEFGFVAAAVSRTLGPVLWWTSLREGRRLARGNRHEPPTIIGRRNWAEA
jgi:radical SAM superfamily enzyme YgiQ (UPF0313 family)